MASIIDKGVETGDINHIYKVGAMMGVLALCGLWAVSYTHLKRYSQKPYLIPLPG